MKRSQETNIEYKMLKELPIFVEKNLLFKFKQNVGNVIVDNFERKDYDQVSFDIIMVAKKFNFDEKEFNEIEKYFNREGFDRDLKRKYPNIIEVLYDKPYMKDNDLIKIDYVVVYF